VISFGLCRLLLHHCDMSHYTSIAGATIINIFQKRIYFNQYYCYQEQSNSVIPLHKRNPVSVALIMNLTIINRFILTIDNKTRHFPCNFSQITHHLQNYHIFVLFQIIYSPLIYS